MFTEFPEPPYYVVVFGSQLRAGDQAAYHATAERMFALASTQPGFLGFESVRGADGAGLTLSYWRDEESIAAWREHEAHLPVQEAGRQRWYERYVVRVARVERAYGTDSAAGS